MAVKFRRVTFALAVVSLVLLLVATNLYMRNSACSARKERELASLRAKNKELEAQLDANVATHMRNLRREATLGLQQARLQASTKEERLEACDGELAELIPNREDNPDQQPLDQKIRRNIILVGLHEDLRGSAKEINEEWREMEPCYARWVTTIQSCRDMMGIMGNVPPVLRSKFHELSLEEQHVVCGAVGVLEFGGVYMDKQVRHAKPLFQWLDLGSVFQFGHDEHSGKPVTWFFAAAKGSECLVAFLDIVGDGIGEEHGQPKGGDRLVDWFASAVRRCGNPRPSFTAEELRQRYLRF